MKANKTLHITNRLLVILAMSVAFVSLATHTPAAQQNDDFSKALDELRALKYASPPDTQETTGNASVDSMLAYDKQRQILADKAYGLYTLYSHDPRRWDAVTLMLDSRPYFYTKRVAQNGNYSLRTNVTAQNAWHQRVDQIVADYRTATDVPDSARESLGYEDISRQIATARAAIQSKKENVSATDIRANLQAYLARYPESKRGVSLLQSYAALYKFAKLPETNALLPFVDSPNAEARVFAKQRLVELKQLDNRLAKPVEMAFTAIDGRAVDFSKMRGKVVLIYFWLSNGPLSGKGLPYLKDAYSKYHDKGLEIVGIILNYGDSKQKVLDFIKKNQIPWPQYYDGKGSRGKYAVQFGVTDSRRFLIDKTGIIVGQGEDVNNDNLDTTIGNLLN